MTIPSDRPIFLERAAYRRRRLQDAARLLPIVTICAMLVPVWLLPKALSGATGMVILFLLWLAVIVTSAALHQKLRRKPPREAAPDEL